MHVDDLSCPKVARVAGASNQDAWLGSAPLENGHVQVVRGNGAARRERKQHARTARKRLRIAEGDAILLDARLEQQLGRASASRNRPQPIVVVGNKDDRVVGSPVTSEKPRAGQAA